MEIILNITQWAEHLHPEKVKVPCQKKCALLVVTSFACFLGEHLSVLIITPTTAYYMQTVYHVFRNAFIQFPLDSLRISLGPL